MLMNGFSIKYIYPSSTQWMERSVIIIFYPSIWHLLSQYCVWCALFPASLFCGHVEWGFIIYPYDEWHFEIDGHSNWFFLSEFVCVGSFGYFVELINWSQLRIYVKFNCWRDFSGFFGIFRLLNFLKWNLAKNLQNC